MSLIGEHVDVCAIHHLLKESFARLSHSPPGNLNKSIISNILQVNKPSNLTGEFYETNLKVLFLSFWLRPLRFKRKKDLPDAAGIYDAAMQHNCNLSKWARAGRWPIVKFNTMGSCTFIYVTAAPPSKRATYCLLMNRAERTVVSKQILELNWWSD